jgi:transposase-like protein
MARRTYTDAERAEALALYESEGPSAVQAKLGIAKATVAGWAKRTGTRTVRNERTAAAVEAARLSWEERRGDLVHRMGEVAERALERADLEVRTGSANDAKNLATTMAILVDKAQLLSGGATTNGHLRFSGEAVTSARDSALRLVAG